MNKPLTRAYVVEAQRKNREREQLTVDFATRLLLLSDAERTDATREEIEIMYLRSALCRISDGLSVHPSATCARRALYASLQRLPIKGLDHGSA